MAVSRRKQARSSSGAGRLHDRLQEELGRLRKENRSLHESIAAYELHFSIANDIMYTYDTSFRIMTITPNVERLLGYTPAELIGRNFQELDLLDPADLRTAVDHAVQVLSGKPEMYSTYRFITKKGESKYGEVSGVPVKKEGKIIGAISVARDISQRVQMEEALRNYRDHLEDLVVMRTEELVKTNRRLNREIEDRERTEHLLQIEQRKFAAAFHESPALMVLTEAETGKIIDASKSAMDLTGYACDEVLGRTSIELGLVSAGARRKLAAEILEKGFVQLKELKLQTRGGNVRDVLLSARLIEINHQPCILSQFLDVTDQRRAEKELKRHRDNLEDLVKERTADLTRANRVLSREIKNRRRTELTLKKRETELERERKTLKEVNAALKTLVKVRESDKTSMEENIVSNIKHSVLPYLEKLGQSGLRENQREYLSIVKSHLNEITSPFIKRLSSQFPSLTPNEVKVASMIREGTRSKDIAELMHVSLNTVHTYRDNIRVKVGLKNDKVNLVSYLKRFE